MKTWARCGGEEGGCRGGEKGVMNYLSEVEELAERGDGGETERMNTKEKQRRHQQEELIPLLSEQQPDLQAKTNRNKQKETRSRRSARRSQQMNG